MIIVAIALLFLDEHPKVVILVHNHLPSYRKPQGVLRDTSLYPSSTPALHTAPQGSRTAIITPLGQSIGELCPEHLRLLVGLMQRMSALHCTIAVSNLISRPSFIPSMTRSLGSLSHRLPSKSEMALVADLVLLLSLRELVTISELMVSVSASLRSRQCSPHGGTSVCLASSAELHLGLGL